MSLNLFGNLAYYGVSKISVLLKESN